MRLISLLTAFCILVSPTFASIGINTSGHQTQTSPIPLILDRVPGAAAAYSLRKLKNNYTGYAILVRRSSDNAQSNIGFTSNRDLDTGALLAFCGSGNGFVVKWYDQSGNGLDVTQATAGNQPQIVASGVVESVGGRPGILFIRANNSNLSVSSSLLPSTTRFINSVFKMVTTPSFADIAMLQASGGANQVFALALNPGISVWGSSNDLNTSVAVGTTIHTASGVFVGGTTTVYLDEVGEASGSFTYSIFLPATLTLGKTSSAIDGYQCEVIVSASGINRQTIEQNQGQYYSIPGL
jgi:Alpha-L-arabinofuranosidase B, catalytic